MATLAEKPLPEMTERLLFSTDIIRPAQDEYRVWRREPRTQIIYTLRLSNERFAALEETIYDNLTATDWVVPFWHERTGNLNLTSSQTVLSVNTNADYRAGGKAMIWQGCDTYEVATIASVGSGSITISPGLTQNYTEAAVMPAHDCFIAAPISTARQFRGLMEATITFQLVTSADLAATAWTTYSGYEVMSCASGYMSRIDGIIYPNVEYFGQDFGPVVQETTRTTHDVLFAAELSSKHWEIKQFLHQVRGRDNPFWIKAWGGQLEVQAASSGAGTITVTTARPAADYVNRHIFIDGQYRQITAAADNSPATTQTLTLSSNLSADVAAGAPVCLISRVRSDTDEIDIQHKHGFSSRVTIPVIEDRAV